MCLISTGRSLIQFYINMIHKLKRSWSGQRCFRPIESNKLSGIGFSYVPFRWSIFDIFQKNNLFFFTLVLRQCLNQPKMDQCQFRFTLLLLSNFYWCKTSTSKLKCTLYRVKPRVIVWWKICTYEIGVGNSLVSATALSREIPDNWTNCLVNISLIVNG